MNQNLVTLLFEKGISNNNYLTEKAFRRVTCKIEIPYEDDLHPGISGNFVKKFRFRLLK